MKQNRLYDELAHLWPWVSNPADYAREAEHWRKALRSKLGPGRHRILELGVGGGHNLSHLKTEFEATAVDLSPQMIGVCRELNPEVELHVGDMRTVRLNKTFDAVLIHDAIAYMLTEDDLRAAFTSAAVHLRTGGIFVTAPDHVKETYKDGAVSTDQSTHDDRQLTFMHYEYDPDPTDTETSTLLVYVIREGTEIRVEEDLHVTGLFPKQVWTDLITSCGFDVEVADVGPADDPRQRYMFVGTRRS